MRKSFGITLFALSLTASPALAQDGLFSDLRIDSVYSTPEKSAPAQAENYAERNAAPRLSGIDSIREMLLIAGFSPKELEEDAAIINVQGDNWGATVRIEVLNARADLLLTMNLSESIDAGQLTRERLLKMLQLNLSMQSATFGCDPESNRLTLQLKLDNRDMTINRLRAAVESLVTLANDHQDAWMFSLNPASAPPANPPAVPPPVVEQAPQAAPTPPPAQSPPVSQPPVQQPSPPVQSRPEQPRVETPSASSLTGKFVATRQESEAIALQLNANNTFVLAIVKKNDKKKSEGSFTLSGQTLTMNGSDGATLSGSVKLTQQGFDLIISQNVSLSFKKAN